MNKSIHSLWAVDLIMLIQGSELRVYRGKKVESTARDEFRQAFDGGGWKPLHEELRCQTCFQMKVYFLNGTERTLLFDPNGGIVF